MKTFTPILLAGIIFITCAGQDAASAVEQSEGSTIDQLLSGTFKPGEPGAAVIVTQNGQTLLRKGYGMADLELQVKIEPDMVFRLGSVTKQFTAVAILMLEEQGKLSVEDPITKFLPDYPTQGHTITVEHLLAHTSGIRSYTSMPEWLTVWRKDFALNELIDFFKNQPMDFAPDEKWLYDNSGYILLGAIIEKASGQPYEDFIRTKIFEPLGMKHSCYDRDAGRRKADDAGNRAGEGPGFSGVGDEVFPEGHGRPDRIPQGWVGECEQPETLPGGPDRPCQEGEAVISHRERAELAGRLLGGQIKF